MINQQIKAVIQAQKTETKPWWSRGENKILLDKT